MRGRKICFFMGVFWALAVCTVLSANIREQMTVEVEVSEAQFGNKEATKSFSVTALSGNDFYELSESSAWESGLKAEIVPLEFYTIEDNQILLPPIDADNKILYRTKELFPGADVEKAGTYQGKEGLYLSIQNGQKPKFLSMAEKEPFMENKTKEALGLTMEDRLYSMKEVENFSKILPKLGILAALILGSAVLWGYIWKLAGKTEENKVLLLINSGLILVLLFGIYKCAGNILLPSSLLPREFIFDWMHYREEFGEITRALGELAEPAALEILNGLERNFRLGILTAGAGIIGSVVVILWEKEKFMYKTKKITQLFLCIFLSVGCLSGCAETPDVVKKEIAEIKKAKQERQELEKNLTYVQPSKLIKDRKNDYFLDHGIFCFDGSVLVPDCKEVYLLKLEVNGNIIQNIDENMAKIFKTFGAEDENWKDHIEFANGVAGKKMDPSQISKGYASQKTCSVLCKDTMVAMDQAGSLYIVKPDTFEHPHYLTDSKNIKNYFFVNDKEDPLDNTIVLDHKEVALRDLNTEFQKTVNLYNSCSPELNLALHDVKIMENVESGEAIAVFRALSNYKGVYFSPDYITFQDTRLTEGKSFVGFRMYQMFHSEEDLFCMRYLEETSYLISKEEKKVDKVIDFDSALNILEQTVPHDKLTTIESAEFLYQTYYEGEEGQQWEWICENAPEFYAFPVWRFVEKERTSEMQATVYYINAVTGKVYSFYETCLP